MASPHSPREVLCYHCKAVLVVTFAARTVTCPHCFKGLLLDDLFVSDSTWTGKLMTCGRVRIERRARAITRTVLAGEGVEVLGALEAKVTSDGPVRVCRGGRVRGDIEASSITVEPGAILEGVHVCIRPRPVPSA